MRDLRETLDCLEFIKKYFWGELVGVLEFEVQLEWEGMKLWEQYFSRYGGGILSNVENV